MTQQTYPSPSFDPRAPQYGPPGAPYGPPAPAFGQPPAPRRRTGVIVGAVAATVLVLGGLVVGAFLLFAPKMLKTADAERQIAQLTEQQAGIAPTDVSCPADIEVEAGATFTCTALLAEQPISFTVTQTDDEGNVQITSDNSFVDVATVEASLAQQVGEAAGVEVVSSCDTDGHAVLVDGVGAPISCTVTNAEDPSDSIEVTATVDESGAVSYEVE
ncbi:DUF4333 domain-containing protein [Blastococcus deserti]|uniref:DUF4333 domain-containing protein n=1 Tax=Blastococcus deserti TaxID=2259033 RepID=A0ABW4X9S0_9ACTN